MNLSLRNAVLYLSLPLLAACAATAPAAPATTRAQTPVDTTRCSGCAYHTGRGLDQIPTSIQPAGRYPRGRY